MPLRVGLDVRTERPGHDPFPQRDLGWFNYALSRPTIEHAVRRRVESRANITLRQRCRVQEMLARPRSVYRDPALVQRVLAKMAEASDSP